MTRLIDTVPQKGHRLVSQGVSSDSTGNFQSLLANPAGHESSFFTSRELKTQSIRPIPFNRYPPDWIPGILLFCFILLAWVQVYYRRRLKQIFMAPWSKRFLSQLTRDGDLFSERIALAMGIIYFLTASLLLYEMYLQVVGKDDVVLLRGFPLYVVITLLTLCFWILKLGLIRFLSFIFRTRQTTREYILNILIFNILTGIFLLPLLVLAVYLNSVIFLWICIIILASFFVFRLFRGFLIGISIRKFSYVFLFVYLCSLEILPLIILTKVILRYYS